MTLSAGDRLGAFEISGSLGKGGMGEVYRAYDSRLRRAVAIKVLPEHLTTNSDALKRFEREARALAALSHPNILTIHDIGAEGDISYVVTELLEGNTLRAHLSRTSLTGQKALSIGIQIAEGLSAAHSKGVIHRDLKPENIFLTDQNVKILDFGLARHVEAHVARDVTSAPTKSALQTESGMMMGTVPYMSPEQVRGESLDARTDIFSFGCVLYEMLTGANPFHRSTTAETIAAILKEDPPALMQSGKPVAPELDRIVMRCLEKDVDRRFQSAGDLAFALRQIQDSTAISSAVAVHARSRRISYKWIAISGALALVILGLVLDVGGLRKWFSGTKDRTKIHSVAVLPLENLSGNPQQEYFADGMTEALITDLAKIRSLKVISRTSAMRYKGADKPLREIGRDLGVDAIIEGSVLQVGDQVRITAQLIDVASDEHLWAESYERAISNILSLQREVASAIAHEIRVQLTPQEQNRLRTDRTVNPLAYESFLKGQFYRAKGTEEAYKEAVHHFQRSIALDPNYALSYSSLASTYAAMGNYGFEPPNETYPKAKGIAQKSLEIDPELAETYGLLGFIKANYDWDWIGAETEYKHAIEMNPGLASAYDLYAYMLGVLKRHDESMRARQKALDMDPVSLPINTNAGWTFRIAGRLDESIVQLRKTVQLDPHFFRAHVWLGQAYEVKGDYGSAVKEIHEARKLSPKTPYVLAGLAHAYATAGDKPQTLRILQDLIELSKQEYVSAYDIAYVYAGLGETEQVFSWLEKAYGERSTWLVLLNVDQLWDPYRNDPRFQELLRRMNFQ